MNQLCVDCRHAISEYRVKFGRNASCFYCEKGVLNKSRTRGNKEKTCAISGFLNKNPYGSENCQFFESMSESQEEREKFIEELKTWA